jgi:hypothetical protein
MLSVIDFESWDNPALSKIYLEYIKKRRHPQMAEKILLFPTETSKKWINNFPPRLRKKIEFRFLAKEDILNFGVDLSILNDVIWAFILKPPFFLGLRIESKPMAATLKLLYKYSWNSALPYKSKKY